MSKFIVTLYRTIPESCDLIVEAENEENAMYKAIAKVHDYDKGEWTETGGDEYMEVISVKKVPEEAALEGECIDKELRP